MSVLIKRFLGILIVLFMISLPGCNDSSMSEGDLQPAKVSLQATVTNLGNANLTAFEVASGSLSISSALLRVDDFEIEVKVSGDFDDDDGDDDDGENEDDDGEDDDGDDDGEDEDDDGEDGDDDGEIDIEVEGPFLLTAAENAIFIDSIQVVAGAFTEFEITFEPSAEEPMLGHSIIIEGEYSPSGGSGIPLSIAIDKEMEIEIDLKQYGYKFTAEDVLSLTVTVSIEEWLGDVGFADAEVYDGAIFIDETHNTEILRTLESGLKDHIELRVQ